MRIAIGAIGQLKRGPEADLISDYLTRASGLGRSFGLKGPDIHEHEAAKGLDGARRMDAEAELLTRNIAPGDRIFVLDERGKALTSREMAGEVERNLNDGAPAMWCLIGGADGHGAAVKQLVSEGKAKRLSFGPATWPHMLVRVMLAEQLYRAVTILAGHPYHRD
ncbi:23S rRNA (pseudouridine(1915)-N(3))-methyltransferase RlmH [Parvularcula flava]|uniref:Ribosomal RNA large subunit methyltransferase H n=1 Tax=Aquisalinus luteolus TaxID=1566827 RepID=A0A8J3A4S3_9PROT|nr:23S rRNA (pseudouridine(1915)-N(3))-methyltransferase RlmH [Aquisalinus luteolus]NHK28453.1 23S rRNA (pseudouridine(1915)-N(3))-methyltransferase RlmH [Aquisalinus luteolus]GGH98522.1 ribosomal RNA large subunit methyltransferase H [Aquisalinus luteolus]